MVEDVNETGPFFEVQKSPKRRVVDRQPTGDSLDMLKMAFGSATNIRDERRGGRRKVQGEPKAVDDRGSYHERSIKPSTDEKNQGGTTSLDVDDGRGVMDVLHVVEIVHSPKRKRTTTKIKNKEKSNTFLCFLSML
jgi:hypothetical protein